MNDANQAAYGQTDPGRRWVNLLLGSGLVASIATFLYPAIRYIIPTEVAESTSRSVVAAKVTELKLNTGKIFKFGSKPALLIHSVAGDWKAFSAVCTHLNCTVQYRADRHDIWCACHNGVYDLSGRNVSGPPPRPLEEFEAHVQGEDVVVTRNA
ncbi:MAG: Rieske (2Fe-2S) protein [Acidobacteria bacterium]|nr:Rieske (2Fe-2S) protein [Acidobacteriota bacterium]